MFECDVTFPGPVSRSTIYSIVVDYLKYVLYYRGQFPLPLDQLKQIIKKESNQEIDANDFIIFRDSPSSEDQNTQKRTETLSPVFTKSISIFDGFFSNLSNILETQDVLEIVLNLGENVIQPKELYHIRLPECCPEPECAQDFASFQHCRLHFFRAIMGSSLWSELQSDTPSAVSVLLLLGANIKITEHMERKRFYSVPKHCKQRTVQFVRSCKHTIFVDKPCKTDKHITNIWVMLKPELKGFKSFK